ncbi:SUKH-4 family immunity protein [Labilibacter marinus]|uniref:SUKH-4 family immunity protein n=1 Tax=Labilibacter marinus TaxID=1477105 RepID=UPI00094F63DB|nr:SUKH-4 family immunity protein [Labilibacter marinus]
MNWSEKFESIIIYDTRRIENYEFDKPTAMFLTTVGLPKDSAPFLSFAENNDIQYEGILRLTDYFDFLETEFEKYIVIGSNGNGDQIVIDVEDNCKIKLLDHDNNFSEEFINNSIEKLHFSLIIYQEFIDNIQKELGEDALFDYKYTDEHLNLLKVKLEKNDPESLIENTFWTEEIEILIANRDDNQ